MTESTEKQATEESQVSEAAQSQALEPPASDAPVTDAAAAPPPATDDTGEAAAPSDTVGAAEASGATEATVAPEEPADAAAEDAAATRVRNIVEAAMLAAGRTLTTGEMLQLFDVTERPTPAQLQAALDRLASEYEGRGIELKQTAAGWRIQVRRELAVEVSRLWPERPQKYSRALLETLALIAYRQPLTRAEIEAVRGVAVNPNIIRTLLERGWIRVVGHRDLPGHPELLGTTREFLDYFGLRSLDELPPLAELKALSEIDPQLELPAAPVSEASVVADAEAANDASAGEERPDGQAPGGPPPEDASAAQAPTQESQPGPAAADTEET